MKESNPSSLRNKAENDISVDCRLSRECWLLPSNSSVLLWDLLPHLRSLPSYSENLRPSGHQSTDWMGPIRFSFWRESDCQDEDTLVYPLHQHQLL